MVTVGDSSLWRRVGADEVQQGECSRLNSAFFECEAGRVWLAATLRECECAFEPLRVTDGTGVRVLEAV